MCRDSIDAEWVYIIKTGSCTVLKSLNETRPNLLGLEHQIYSAEVKSVKGNAIIFPRTSVSLIPMLNSLMSMLIYHGKQ